jgi:hypothetical protein
VRRKRASSWVVSAFCRGGAGRPQDLEGDREGGTGEEKESLHLASLMQRAPGSSHSVALLPFI